MLHFEIRQGHAGGEIAGTESELPVGSSITISGQGLSCSQGTRTAQRGPEGHAVCAAQHKPVLALVKQDVDH